MGDEESLEEGISVVALDTEAERRKNCHYVHATTILHDNLMNPDIPSLFSFFRVHIFPSRQMFIVAFAEYFPVTVFPTQKIVQVPDPNMKAIFTY